MRKLHCSLMGPSLLIGCELLAGGPIPRATIQDNIYFIERREFVVDSACCCCLLPSDFS